MGEEKRHEMMQNLFGDQSEEEEEIDSEHESNPHPNYASDEAEGVMEPEGEGEGEVEVEGHGEAEVESDGDLRDLEPDPGESEGERVQSSQEVDIGDQREESEAKETDSDEKEDYGQRVVTSRRREVIESGSERSEENHYPDNEDEEVDQTRSLSKSPEEEKDPTHLSHSAAEIRDVFGASDEEEEEAEYAVRHDMEQEEIRSPMEEEGSYGKSKFLLSLKRIRLENNIVRWRTVRKKDGTTSYESNARFVRWSDGSLQLLIGNEVLDISVQEAQHDQSHLFLRHGKGILQSQGRILSKMRFMPSSLSSNSHRLLTALVDSHHKKVYKVKNCITDVDPEREKEEKEKAENQTIRANVLLNRKREKVNRKYTQTVERKRQLSTGYLEGALDEDDEMDYNDSRRSRRRFEEDLEVEARAEKRIMNAKKSQGYRDVPRKSSVSDVKSSRRPISFSESDREESEYETEGEEDERSAHNRIEDEEPEYEESEEEEEEERYEEADANANRASEEEEEVEEPRQKVKESVGSSKRKGIESDEDSPPRKAPTHRRMAVVYDSDEE